MFQHYLHDGLQSILPDSNRISRVLAARRIKAELDTIAESGKSVPPFGGFDELTGLPILTPEQQAFGHKLHTWFLTYDEHFINDGSPYKKDPSLLEPIEVLAFIDEGERLRVVIKVLRSFHTSTLETTELFRRSSVLERIKILNEYGPISYLKEWEKLLEAWAVLATFCVTEHLETFKKMMALMESLERVDREATLRDRLRIRLARLRG